MAAFPGRFRCVRLRYASPHFVPPAGELFFNTITAIYLHKELNTTGLSDQLDQKHLLYQLASKINWLIFDDAFKKHYSEKMGKPAKRIRLMVSLLILKYVRNLSDENLVDQWAENIYFQYFSGEQHF